MPLIRFSVQRYKNGRTTGAFRFNLKFFKKLCRLYNVLGKIKQRFTYTNERKYYSKLNLAYKYLFFPQGEHKKLLFGDDLPNAIKEFNEINKVLIK